MTSECSVLDSPRMSRAPDVSRQEQAEAILLADAPRTTPLTLRVPVVSQFGKRHYRTLTTGC